MPYRETNIVVVSMKNFPHLLLIETLCYIESEWEARKHIHGKAKSMLLLQYTTIWFKFRNDKAKSMLLLQYTTIWFKFRNNTKYRIQWKNIWHDFRLGMHCFGLSRIYACFLYTDKLKCRFRVVRNLRLIQTMVITLEGGEIGWWSIFHKFKLWKNKRQLYVNI